MKNNLDFNLKSFRKYALLSVAILLIVAAFFSSLPLLSNVQGQVTYTITYDMSMGGTNPNTITSYSTSTSDITLLDAEHPNHPFIGWNGFIWSNPPIQFISQRNLVIPAGTSGHIDLAAIFDTSVFRYPINYILNDGINSASNKLSYFGDYENFPIVISAPYKAGYAFLGWTATFSDGKPPVTVPTTTFSIQAGTTGAVTLTAHWSNPIDYVITYDLTADVVHSGPSTYNVVQLPQNIGIPSRVGYDFSYWLVTCVNGSSVNLPGTAIPVGTIGAVTLSPTWTPLNNFSYKVVYYDASNGNIIATDSLFGAIGSSVTANVRVFTGYTFASGDNRNVLSGTILSDDSLVLSVYYTPHPDDEVWYTLTYNGNGYTGRSVPADRNSHYLAGSQVTVLGQGNMVRAGYTFLGWSPSSTASFATFTTGSTFIINNDVVLYAIWTENTYIVTYQPGTHGTFTAQTTNGLHYGDATPAAPTVTGETGWNFIGWSPVPTTTVTGNATYIAQWTQTSYTTPTSSPYTSEYAFTSPAPFTSAFPTLTPSNSGEQPGVSNDGSKWAIVNLLVSVIGVILATTMVLFVLLIKRKPGKQSNVKNQKPYGKCSLIWLGVVVVLAVVGVVVFLVTEDLSLPSGWIADKWTIVNVVIFAVECIIIWLCLKTSKTRINNNNT
jgi:uncharacterized repeat protein (TIGR02543 family)